MDSPKTRQCLICPSEFIITNRMRKNRQFCSRACYKESMRKFDSVPYPMIWYRGKREYLHRVIYMEHHNVVLTSEQIIHHKDENPYNRDISNLELVTDRAAHLYTHGYFVERRRMKKDPRTVDMDEWVEF